LNKEMEFLEIGKIVKTHGLKGRVKVLSYLEPGEDGLLQSLDEVFIGREKDRQVKFGLRAFQVKGKCFYLEMEGVENIDQAETLLGQIVWVPADKLGSLEEDEYYWQQLLGLEVVTEEGQPVGKIIEIFPTGSNDVFVCRDGEKETLLPAIADVVRHVDLEKGVIQVRLLEGM